jgi:hypothetical protein
MPCARSGSTRGGIGTERLIPRRPTRAALVTGWHAYLHRKEGDAGNAAYWYRRARKPVCRTSVDEEWAAIAGALLKAEGGEAA